jgi:hypothetical protein
LPFIQIKEKNPFSFKECIRDGHRLKTAIIEMLISIVCCLENMTDPTCHIIITDETLNLTAECAAGSHILSEKHYVHSNKKIVLS